MDWEKFIITVVLCVIKQLQEKGYKVPEPLRSEAKRLLDSK